MGAFPVEPGDEFAVDLAGGGEFLISLGELLFRFGQGVFEVRELGCGGARMGVAAEFGERVAAEDLDESTAQCSSAFLAVLKPPISPACHCMGVRTAIRPGRSRFSPMPISSP